ncbi:hypothetical protein LX32DRAFT_248067 [Colletotrichum zoysiae]|uniref:Uncharacterized protein n=1 Tax=Colletotrichum zoysiae TaxID=1216348 RepID=A0AAD9LV31_9PEZI|nr:hypothetical protein LX32DRAFT_248067 [Colletotrichum zoysiae]
MPPSSTCCMYPYPNSDLRGAGGHFLSVMSVSFLSGMILSVGSSLHRRHHPGQLLDKCCPPTDRPTDPGVKWVDTTAILNGQWRRGGALMPLSVPSRA